MHSFFGFDILHALHNRRALSKADVVWTMLEGEWLSVSALQVMGLVRRRPLIANSVWLVDRWLEYGRKYRLINHALMTRHAILTLHSSAALARTRALIPDRTFVVNPFGVSTRNFPLSAPVIARRSGGPIRVYSIGNDSTRDWDTMLEAFGDDDRFEVTIVGPALTDDKAARYANLTAPRNPTASEQRRLYEAADVVVMPMVENSFSGCTVVCEAVAMGKPVISSRTGGVGTYFGENEVIFVPPGDPAAGRAAVLDRSLQELEGYALRAQARFRTPGYSALDLCRRYLRLSEQALAGVPPSLPA